MYSAKSSNDFQEMMVLLKETPLFSGQSTETIARIAQDFYKRIYYPKQIIFNQGELSHSLYVLMSGKVRTYHLTVGGDENRVNLLGRGQLLGEFSITDQQAHLATAQAISTCTLLEMNHERALYYLETVPGLALAMCRQLIFKMRWTSLHAEMLAYADATERLSYLLLLYSEQFGQVIEPGKRYLLDLGLNQSDLATLVGTTRGWVNEILQKWRNRGLVEFTDGKLLILDVPKLLQEVHLRGKQPLK